MWKYILTILLHIVIAQNIIAQPIEKVASYTVLGDKNTVNVKANDLLDYKILDTTIITVRYNLFSRVNQNVKLKYIDDIVLQIGLRYTQCYPATYHKIDSLKTVRNLKIDAPMIVDLEQIVNLKNHTICVINRMPSGMDKLLLYQEPVPKFKWEILTDKAQICGYDCHIATTLFRGRQWTMWFTPDLPYNAGPYKFSGLPGLILQAASSDGDYIFSCASIHASNSLIMRYNWNYKVLKRSQVQSSFASFFHAPLFYLGGTPDHLNLFATKEKQLDDSWTIDYNPIELE